MIFWILLIVTWLLQYWNHFAYFLILNWTSMWLFYAIFGYLILENLFFSNLNKVTKDGKPFEKLVMILKFYIEHLILIPRYCRFKIKTDWVAPRNVFLYFYCWNVLISATKVRINNNNKMKRNWFEYQPFKIFEICMERPMV